MPKREPREHSSHHTVMPRAAFRGRVSPGCSTWFECRPERAGALVRSRPTSERQRYASFLSATGAVHHPTEESRPGAPRGRTFRDHQCVAQHRRRARLDPSPRTLRRAERAPGRSGGLCFSRSTMWIASARTTSPSTRPVTAGTTTPGITREEVLLIKQWDSAGTLARSRGGAR